MPAPIPTTYGTIARSFHWLIVALLLGQYATKLILPYVLPKSAEDAIDSWHLSIGAAILIVMVLRLAWRLSHTPPPPPADLPPSMRLLSRAIHWAFYAVLIVLPALGWVSANAFGVTPRVFGIGLPALVGPDKALGEAVGDVHGVLAIAVLALIALHVAGALYHLLVKRDGVMGRMLPGAGPGTSV